MEFIWYVVAYIVASLCFFISMFIIVGPRMAVSRIEKWINSGNFDKTMENFIKRYGPVIFGTIVDSMVNRITASIRGNQGVIRKEIKKAKTDLADSILSEGLPLISQGLKQMGMNPKDPQTAGILTQALGPFEHKAQNGIAKVIEQFSEKVQEQQ